MVAKKQKAMMKIRKTLKTKQWASRVVCLVAATLLPTTYAVVAQEVRIGGITVSIPKRTKPSAKTTASETPAPKTEAGETSERRDDIKTDARPASPASTTQSDVWLEIILEEINKRKKEVENFDPTVEGRQLVTPSTPELFFPAISMRARERYFKSVQMNDSRRSALNTALDSLAAAAAQKLPLYKPDTSLFAFRNPPSEQMMRASLKNAATLKVHKIGIKESVWLIEKNQLGLPVDRYKHGYIWARDTNDDHAYCHLYTLHITQTYEGGGTYGQTFVKLSEDELFGCP